MGWVIREGFNCFDPLNPGVPPAKCTNLGPFGETMTDPVMEYDHSVGIAIIGGHVYRGSAYPPLQGKYVFGDFIPAFTGTFFYMDTVGPEAFVRQEFFIAPEGDPFNEFIFGYGEDEDGELYVLTSANVAIAPRNLPVSGKAKVCIKKAPAATADCVT